MISYLSPTYLCGPGSIWKDGLHKTGAQTCWRTSATELPVKKRRGTALAQSFCHLGSDTHQMQLAHVSPADGNSFFTGPKLQVYWHKARTCQRGQVCLLALQGGTDTTVPTG